jgi:hypothetical protein
MQKTTANIQKKLFVEEKRKIKLNNARKITDGMEHQNLKNFKEFMSSINFMRVLFIKEENFSVE